MTNQRIVNTDPITLSQNEREELVDKKATCPFIGTAVMAKELPVRNNAHQPLASIEDVVRLGNSGGGDLGQVLEIFAKGNHAFMLGNPDKLDKPVPAGLFSLDFPGSQGSHAGHSGILQGDPRVLDSGRFSLKDFKRLTDKATNGLITLSAVGKFIAENLVRDTNSKVVGPDLVFLLGKDLARIVLQSGPFLSEQLTNLVTGKNMSVEARKLAEKMTKLAGENNLLGSAGEFGLLFAFFANKPGGQMVESEPALSVEDLTLIFEHKQFPPGWKTWKKTASSWVTSTIHLVASAIKEFEKLPHA